MVLGNGLIAKAFTNYRDNDEVIIYASGVSKSIETKQKEFNREFQLLKHIVSNYPNAMLIYFSTISINDSTVNKRPYIAHKLNIESFIKNNVKSYLIFRVSNVVGNNTNAYTVLNFLFNAISKEEYINIWPEAERNLLDIDDLKFLVESLIESKLQNRTVSLCSRQNIPVKHIVKEIENFLNKKANVNIVKRVNNLNIDTSLIDEQLKDIELVKGNGVNYLRYLLKKYYSKT